MKTKSEMLNTERKLLVAKATQIHKLQEQLAKRNTIIEILHAQPCFTNLTNREKLDAMRELSDKYSVRTLADAFKMPRGTYYNDILRAKGEGAWFRIHNRELTPHVLRIFNDSNGTYGSEMIAAKLRLDGRGADPRTVKEIMDEHRVPNFVLWEMKDSLGNRLQ